MARDSRVRMRDGLVIPGALLTFYGFVAILYAEVFRARSDFCADSNLILIAGVCYTVWKIILPIVLIGLALVITGATAFRGEPEELEGHLHHGTVAHTALALLISLVAIPFIGWLVQTIREANTGEVFELSVLGARYEHTFLLELAMLIGLLMLVPFLCLYIFLHVKRRRFEREAEALLLEDRPLPHERGFQYGDAVPASEAHAASMMPDEAWPAGREGEPEGPASEERCQAPRCPNPPRQGTRFCGVHGCKGQTIEGQACRNAALPGESYCPVHKRAAQPPAGP